MYKSLTLNIYIYILTLEGDEPIQPCGTNGKSKLFGRCSVGGLLSGHPGLVNPFSFRAEHLFKCRLFCSSIDYSTHIVAGKSMRRVGYRVPVTCRWASRLFANIKAYYSHVNGD